jgi:hypothetical protein
VLLPPFVRPDPMTLSSPSGSMLKAALSFTCAAIAAMRSPHTHTWCLFSVWCATGWVPCAALTLSQSYALDGVSNAP